MTTRGFNEDEFKQIGKIIARALKNSDDEKLLKQLKKEVLELTRKHPLWY